MRHDRITFRDQLTGMAFATPYLVGMLLFLLIPLGMSLYYSFCEYPILKSPMWIGLDNYVRLLGFHRAPETGRLVANDPVFYQVLRNTLLYAAGSVPLSLGVSVLLAVLLNRPIAGRAFFRTVIFLPSLIPAVAGAMLWLWIFNGQSGLLNALLDPLYRLLHIKPPNWLGTEAFIKPLFIFLSLYAVGNAVVIFLAGLQDIPTELYEAALIDGISARQRFFHITLPMLSPVIFFNLIMGIIGAWQVFTVPYIMVGTGVNRAGYFYSQYLFDRAFMDQRMGYASAMAYIQFLIILALTLLTIWSSRRWVHYR